MICWFVSVDAAGNVKITKKKKNRTKIKSHSILNSRRDKKFPKVKEIFPTISSNVTQAYELSSSKTSH